MMIRFTSNDWGYLDCEHYVQSDFNIVTISIMDNENIYNICFT